MRLCRVAAMLLVAIVVAMLGVGLLQKIEQEGV